MWFTHSLNYFSTYNTFSEGSSFEGGQSQVPNFDRACRSGDKDVITFQVPVDDGRGSGVEKMKALQNLPAPASQHLGFHDLEPLEIAAGMKDKKKEITLESNFIHFSFFFTTKWSSV